ncbi:MAG TPA: hypothetical protein VMP01_27175 [Pirellulaceae bacterium]|nr:hypothetical protein [Pirellulaceae bacterium]
MPDSADNAEELIIDDYQDTCTDSGEPPPGTTDADEIDYRLHW